MFRVTKGTWTIITTLQNRQKLWCSQSEKLCSSDIISISISKVLDVLYKLAPPSREHRETWGPGERWLTLHKFSWLFLNRRATICTTTRHTHGGCLACVEDLSVFLLRFIKELKDIFCLSRVTFWTSDTVYWSDCKWLLSKQRVIIDISF